MFGFVIDVNVGTAQDPVRATPPDLVVRPMEESEVATFPGFAL
jgi:hypothetical protein